jgi:hypothetical protein
MVEVVIPKRLQHTLDLFILLLFSTGVPKPLAGQIKLIRLDADHPMSMKPAPAKFIVILF